MKEKMLEGKVAIVSGASYGMGETMAELFAKEGAKVVMTARGKEKLEAAVNRLKEQGLEVTGVVADNKNLEDVKNVIRTALTVYGDLDIVINNAAIGEQKMIDETDDEWLEQKYSCPKTKAVSSTFLPSMETVLSAGHPIPPLKALSTH